MNVDPRFLKEDGHEIFTGNELLLKGALEVEGGVHLLGGYPGSPIAGFFDSIFQLQDLLKSHGVRAAINNNEALSAAMLNGTQVIGLRGLICMKSVGVHVAADALALGAMAGAHPDGGAVVVYGDDPWSDSTQVASDSRYISRHLYIPVIEPSSPQEVKDFVDLAFKLSAASELYAGFILPNNLADGGGTVECRPNNFPDINTYQIKTIETAALNHDKFVLLPPRTWWQEEKFAPRFKRACRLARQMGLNRIENGPPPGQTRPVGLVSSGLAYGYLKQALWEMGLDGELPILKYGMSYPLDEEILFEFAGQCDRLVVVEERRGFMQEQIAEALSRGRQEGKVRFDLELWGKNMPAGLEGFPITRGLHPSLVIGVLAPLLKTIGLAPGNRAIVDMDALDREMRTIADTAEADVAPPIARMPTFCPGCPHRDTASLCLEIRRHFGDRKYMQETFGRPPVDLMFHGDTGCYTMLMFPPNSELMHDYSGMGLGAGTGSGIDPFITNKQAVFMGDSTFFHSGKIAISQAIKLGQDITFIILDNRITAMTGHQPTPGVEWDVLGEATEVQDIEEIINGIAGANDVPVVRMDPSDRQAYRKRLESMLLADGVKVMIADKECGITRNRRLKQEQRRQVRELGYLPLEQRMNINHEICRFCLACADMTGCPGLKHVDTDYGRKMATDLTNCVNDGACARIGACWSFEQVTIKRKRAQRSRVPELGLDDIPQPHLRPHGEMWHCYLAGVGGMGIGLATQILVRAGHREGYNVAFVDKKGLAIRNGGVNSQVAFMKQPKPSTGMIPFGKADLLLGVDVLEAARAMDPTGRSRVADPQRTAAVVNTAKIQTISSIMGRADFDVEQLEQVIRANTRGDDYLARDISRICETYLGSKIYANIMMLGFAFQKGLIPVSMASISWAIENTIRADYQKNLYAFNMGRKFVEAPSLFQGPPQPEGWSETLEQLRRHALRRYPRGSKPARLMKLAGETVEKLSGLDEGLKRDVVVRIYDCLRWGGIRHARKYAHGVMGVYAKDSAARGYAATRAVIFNLAKAMLIKDAVYIAELATSPEKYARDRARYNITPAQGDKIAYRHLTPIKLRVGRWESMVTPAVPDWVFKVLKRMKFLRAALPFWHWSHHKYRRHYQRRVARFDPADEAQYRKALLVLGSSRCMKCQSPTCSDEGCPLGNLMPQWIDLAYRHDWAGALEILESTNNFPEFTARVCPAPCQGGCKQGAEDYPVQIRELERRVIDHAVAMGLIRPRPAAEKTGRRVAVVGSGPAGLAAAQQLARMGHAVTVFERSHAPGGLLRRGIPDERLAKVCIDRRIEQMTGEGVTFVNDAEIDAEAAARLRGEFDAICLACGATEPRIPDIEGVDRPEVVPAMTFLTRQNDIEAGLVDAASNDLSARGKRVVVIGGGETGGDCARTALKQGAAEVVQVEIMPESAVSSDPTHDDSVEMGRRIKRHWQSRLESIRDGADGGLSLRLRRVKWSHTSDGLKMSELDDEPVEIKADRVLLATGFIARTPEPIAEGLGLDLDDDGRLDLRDMAVVGGRGVFAAGDLVEGPSLVARAIASGRKVATRIDEYLTGESHKLAAREKALAQEVG